jgi:putative toxin-antitoxin system antitoxin component (TIGR02293 family)
MASKTQRYTFREPEVTAMQDAPAMPYGTPKTLATLGSLTGNFAAEVVQHGLPASLARELADQLGLTVEEVAALLRSAPRTVARRFQEGRLDQAESERVWELAQLLKRATEVFENGGRAIQWFRSPVAALQHQTPLQVARTTPGIRELERELGRIEHGLFA